MAEDNSTTGASSTDTTAPKTSPFGALNDGLDFDVLIIGGGLSGICAVHRMVQMGLRARVLEAGPSEGGTWFWNRYPGARFDSESYSYIFSFAPEILAEWDWTEHFAPQAETLRYIQFMTRRLDVRRHMQFDTRVVAMHFDEEADGSGAWRVVDQHGRTYTARFVVTAMGLLHEPTLPAIDGLEDFGGETWHTARWPAHATVASLAGRRVGIVGTGATGIQTIQTIAPVVGHLTVFQRTANWTAPLRNAAIGPDEMAAVRAAYPAIFAQCARTPQGFLHGADAAASAADTLAMDPAERTRRWEALFAQRGFSKTLGVAADVHTSPAANALYSAFHAAKIRARVRDPAVADLLVPRTHGFGTRRVPLEMDYYEAFNRPNVRLVDVAATPIARATPDGVLLADGTHHALDVLVFATGFDAVTGSLRAVDIRGRAGRRLVADAWAGPDGLQTLLGLAVHGFPNLFMVMGPHQMFGNIPRSIEHAVDWIARFLAWAAEQGFTYADPTPAAMAAWTAHVHACADGLLASAVDSWLTGVNSNLAHKQTRSVLRYTGPAPQYRARCDAVRAGGYKEFVLR